MSKSKHPIALLPLPILTFLDYLLHHHTSPTTLIICSTRAAFLDSLKASIASSYSAPPPEHSATPPPPHYLLHPTLHLIAISRTITCAFTPTLPHLRAYLATYCPPRAPDPSASEPLDPASRPPRAPQQPYHHPILAIWDFVTVHRATADHSAQGLSRTLAVAVEAAKLAEQRLILAEPVEGLSDELGAGEGGGGRVNAWRERVPLLSGVVAFGIGGENGVVGRTVEVRDVVGRWCRFVGMEELGEGS